MPDTMRRMEDVNAAKFIGGHGLPGISGNMVHDVGAGTAKHNATRTSKIPYTINHKYVYIPRFRFIANRNKNGAWVDKEE